MVTALKLNRIPDHSTLCRMFKRMTRVKIRQMERLVLERMKPCEEVIGLDSTGFRADQASAYYAYYAYYQLRCGKDRKEWIKGAYAVGTSSMLILSSRQGDRATGLWPRRRRTLSQAVASKCRPVCPIGLVVAGRCRIRLHPHSP